MRLRTLLPLRGRRVRGSSGDLRLPSLFRFILVLGVIAALVYGGMIALVTFVQVQPREITETIQLPKPGK